MEMLEFACVDSNSVRIDAIADLSNVLIEHEGETTLNYSISLIGLVSDIPAPGTAAVPVVAGLLDTRRRREQ